MIFVETLNPSVPSGLLAGRYFQDNSSCCCLIATHFISQIKAAILQLPIYRLRKCVERDRRVYSDWLLQVPGGADRLHLRPGCMSLQKLYIHMKLPHWISLLLASI